MKVDIYLETDSIAPAAYKRKYGYVLAVSIHGAEKTKEGFGKCDGTYHQTILKALQEALGRMTKSCEITVHSRNAYVISNLSKWKKLVETNFKDSKGNDIRNVDMWREVCKGAEKHEISVKLGQHEYSSWLLDEMRKR